MSSQGAFWDLPEGRRRRDEGINKVSRHEAILKGLQLEITRACKAKGWVTSDDIYHYLPEGVHFNIIGAAFHTHPSIWRTQETIQSKRSPAHGRRIHVWRLKA